MSGTNRIGAERLAPSRRLGFAAFRHRDFAVYSVGSLLGNLAYQIQVAALFWQIYDLSGSTLALATIGLLEFLPAPLLLAITGPVADRVERRLIVQRGYFVQVIGALLLTWLSVGQPARIWPFFVVAFLFGCVRAFSSPAGRAMVPALVPSDHLGNAIAWRSTGFQMAIIGGPVAAGLLYGFGPATVYGTVAALMVVASGTMFLVSRRPPAQSSERPGWASLLAGLRFIRGQPVLLGAISLDLFAVLFGGATALLPVYAKDILHVGPAEYGYLRAAASVGGLLMAVSLAAWPLRRRVGRKMFLAVAVFGGATIGFGLSTSIVLSLIALMFVGAADMISVFVRSNVVPLATPNQMLGRVTAVEMVFIGASNELGTFESGAVAWLIGPVATVVLGGVATLAIVGLWIRLFPALYRFDRLG
ncbi:MAG: MFS transporter [Dongiaceae bacterium]